MQCLLTLGGPELWMPLGNESRCWDFLLHGVYLDVSSSVPDLSGFFSASIRPAEPLQLLSQEVLSQSQCSWQGKIASRGGMQL